MKQEHKKTLTKIVIFVFLIIAFRFIFGYLLGWIDNKITENRINSIVLNSPQVNEIKSDIGASEIISGNVYPGATVEFYINEKKEDYIIAGSDGKFSRLVLFHEGENKLKIRQSYYNKVSKFTRAYYIVAHVKGPSSDEFNITSSVPEITNSNKLKIKGISGSYENITLKNQVINAKTNSDGEFEADINLQEGDNNLEFFIQDKYGNTTKVSKQYHIFLDSIPPTILANQSVCYSFNKNSLPVNEELVCIDSGDWQGRGEILSIPIIGNIVGKVKKITVDGKEISWNEVGEIYSRIDLKVLLGLNRFRTEVEDFAGNKSIKYLDISSKEVEKNPINVNLNQ